ncbi:MAG: dihydrodipicolinate synthetase [Chitinophagaceae bacterium]|nr:dihydrodipicolinate synthetase [Chitinophagaceae bacterium]
MKKNINSSRRSFIEKIAAGTLSLTVSAGIGEKLYSPQRIHTAAGVANQTGLTDLNEKKFVPVMITPYTTNAKIDFNALSRLIDFYLTAGVKGFFANCLSSEMFNLDEEERLALTRHVVKHVNGAVPVVASGSFGQSLEDKAEFTKKIYHTGISAVILITNHFANKEDSDDMLIRNFEKFFALTDNIPIGTYECPSPYKRILTPVVFKYLLETNRLIYHKDTTLDVEKVKTKLELAKNNRLELYDAHTPNAMYSLQMGAKGMSAIAGNFYPEILVWMCNNAVNPARQEDVKWLQSELTRVDSIVSRSYPMSSKYFLQKRGLPILPVSRSNATQLTQEQKSTLDEVYEVLSAWRERLGIKMMQQFSPGC